MESVVCSGRGLYLTVDHKDDDDEGSELIVRLNITAVASDHVRTILIRVTNSGYYFAKKYDSPLLAIFNLFTSGV